jgi:hypothetical protein
LTLLIEDIDRACRLADDQKDKIYLTGQGDIKRVFDAFEKAKERFRALNNDPQLLQQLVPDTQPVRSAVQGGGVFSHDSLVFKSMRHTLTADQMAKYDSVTRERQAFQHRATIQRVLAMIEQMAPLRVEQRRALSDLLVKETKPVAKASQYDVYLAIVQVGRLPEQKVKPLLDASQWKMLTQLVEQYREIEPALRQEGLIPNDDPAPVPPAKPGR